MNHAAVGVPAGDGHLERVDDELLAHVIGERPPHDPAAEAVITDARYNHPSHVRI